MRTLAEWNYVVVRPAAGGESCEAGFYFHDRNLDSLESERKDQIDGTKYNL